MSYQTIVYKVEDSVAWIILNRPERLNALSLQSLAELDEALRKAEGDSHVRCLVITGEGRGFCAGADLQELLGQYQAGKAPPLGENLRARFNPIIQKIRKIEKPVIALINGAAAGAGLGLALACDIRIASEKATFVEAFARVGLVPDSGTSFFLPRMLGLSKALELAFTGDGIDARDAERFSLVNKVVAAEELEKVGRELAKRLAAGPTKGIGLTKRAINSALATNLETALAYEAQMQEIAGRTRDHLEGVRAFLEKRPAVYKGE